MSRQDDNFPRTTARRDAGNGGTAASRTDPLDTVPAAVLLKSLLIRAGRGVRSIWALLLAAATAAGGRICDAWARLPKGRLPRTNFARPRLPQSWHFRSWAPARLPRPGLRQLGIFLLAAAVALPAAFVIFCFATLPTTPSAAATPNTGAFVLRAAGGRPLATRGVYKGDPITAGHIPQPLGNAVVAIEDRRFYTHAGIDLRGILRAFWNDVTGGDLQGASTITQQLARLRYLSPERTLKRKVQEAMLAIWLDWRLDKREILAEYLNSVYFGYGAYGADAAAQRYFSKHAADLSLNEAAMLAGLIRAPSALSPDKNLEGARKRADVVLDAMRATGAVAPEKAKAAQEHPAKLHVAAEPAAGSNYFIDTAVREAKALPHIAGGDLALETTLDPAMQRYAESVVEKYLHANETAKDVHQAALVAMRRDGAIVAMVGGRDYRTSQFNRVTQAERQPGSLFKLFVYLAALRQGFTPDDTMVDRPITIGNWTPENYGDHYYGRVSLRTAFAHSLNSVAVQLAEEVGVDRLIQTAKRAGIRSELPNAPSIALGSGTVTLLEMTSAFAAVASNVEKIEPFTIREADRGGKPVYTRAQPRREAADDVRVHQEMMDILESPVREGTATAARLRVPVGGKTGTSQDYRDAWFVGFTPNLVVGVWVGNDDNRPMKKVTGGSLPAAIWHDFVAGADRISPPAETVSMAPMESAAASVAGSPAGRPDSTVSGKLRIMRDGSVQIGGRAIQLAGVDKLGGTLPRRIRHLLRRLPVTCTLAEESDAYDCVLGDLDLNAAILLSNGDMPNVQASSEDRDEADDSPPAPRHQRRRGHRHFWLFRW